MTENDIGKDLNRLPVRDPVLGASFHIHEELAPLSKVDTRVVGKRHIRRMIAEMVHREDQDHLVSFTMHAVNGNPALIEMRGKTVMLTVAELDAIYNRLREWENWYLRLPISTRVFNLPTPPGGFVR